MTETTFNTFLCVVKGVPDPCPVEPSDAELVAVAIATETCKLIDTLPDIHL